LIPLLQLVSLAPFAQSGSHEPPPPLHFIEHDASPSHRSEHGSSWQVTLHVDPARHVTSQPFVPAAHVKSQRAPFLHSRLQLVPAAQVSLHAQPSPLQLTSQCWVWQLLAGHVDAGASVPLSVTAGEAPSSAPELPLSPTFTVPPSSVAAFRVSANGAS
jgi:hypothetical protein